MFETLFKYPRVLARHREGPVADARERFLIHCAQQGLARESLLRTAREVLIIAKHIDLTNGTAISIHDVEAAADRWDAHQQRRYRLRGSALEGSRQLFNPESPALASLPWPFGTTRQRAHSFHRPDQGLCHLHAQPTRFICGHDP